MAGVAPARDRVGRRNAKASGLRPCCDGHRDRRTSAAKVPHLQTGEKVDTSRRQRAAEFVLRLTLADKTVRRLVRGGRFRPVADDSTTELEVGFAEVVADR